MTNENPEMLTENPEKQPKKSNIKGVVAAASIAIAVAVGAVAVNSYANNEAQEKVDSFIENAESESSGDLKITYKDVGASVMGQDLEVSGITIYDQGSEVLTAQNLNLSVDGYKAGETLPSSSSFTVSGIKIKGEEITNQVMERTGIDYKERTIDIHGGYNYKSDNNGNLKLSGSMSVSDLNELGVYLHLSKIGDAWTALQSAYADNSGELELTSEQSQTLVDNLGNAVLTSASFSYENNGEIEHFMKLAASESGISMADFKARLPVAIDKLLGDTTSAKELKKFVANPDKLVVSANPSTQVSLSQLPMMFMGIAMGRHKLVIENLNVKVEAY